ncbi:helix-turn-helix domain-containing protein [Amycolatopsis sp. NPDC059021]|uniref:helix-turn-helix domain-containing protein n=1 Tax=Amycolatopsis sp. NPDC059021 TaxID=3346704 RepID=UPI00366F9DE6
MKPTTDSPCARALAASLRGIRGESGLSLSHVARMLDMEKGMLSFWERCLRLPRPDQVARLLGCLRVSEDRYERLMNMAYHARDTNWLPPGVAEDSTELSPGLIGVMECERVAKQITTWQPVVVPGLLQTADYARAIISEGDISLEQADLLLITRLSRQNILTRQNPVQLLAIIAESVLLNEVGNEDIMSDQIDHLLRMIDLPHVSVRIVPDERKYHRGKNDSFVLYEFDDQVPVLYAEHTTGGSFRTEEQKIASHRGLATVLLDKAMTEEASRMRLKEAVR